MVLDTLKNFGREKDIAVIPVSSQEAKMFSHRLAAQRGLTTIPGFPFLSLYGDSRQTQLVASFGVGHHKIIGLSIDTSMMLAEEKFAKEIEINLRAMDPKTLKTQLS